MTDKEFASYLKSIRSTTQEQVDEVNKARDAKRGLYVPHQAHREHGASAH